MHIRAAVARAPDAPFSLEEVELDDPAPGEVLVRVVGVGLCHTDLIARDQFIPIPLPAVLGHEGSGVVERVGEGVTGFAPGDRVVISFNSCGHCGRCAEQRPSYCVEFPALNYTGLRFAATERPPLRSKSGEAITGDFFGQSSFATHALTHARNLVKVGDEAPLELLGPLGCGFQTGAGAVLRSMDCPPGSSLMVIGAGAVGMAAVVAGVIRGCHPIIAVDPLASRRAFSNETSFNSISYLDFEIFLEKWTKFRNSKL